MSTVDEIKKAAGALSAIGIGRLPKTLRRADWIFLSKKRIPRFEKNRCGIGRSERLDFKNYSAVLAV